MSLQRSDFAGFFSAVNGGRGTQPFRWQERLLDHLLTEGRWPDQINAPTGSGKSAVVDIHVFATALAAVGAAPRLPRRLVVVVNRRALVDAQFDRAEHIRGELCSRTDDVTAAVADALARLQPERAWVSAPENQPPTAANTDVLVVTNLRGGLAPARGWIDEPTCCQVIAATPDMFGSRLLMRGYGTSAQARPREAGLLGYDTVAVVDEAHLSRQLLMSARRIADLEGFATSPAGVPVLQVVETTATPTRHTVATVGVEDSDLSTPEDAALAARLTRPKPLTYVESPAWPTTGKAGKQHVELLAENADALCRLADGVVGCIVNRVDTAVRVAATLAGRGRDVAVWVGPRRPDDIETLRTDYPQLLAGTAASDEKPLDVLVATQTVEVGVDLDLSHLVTELASASALAQRVGRVNRIGARPAGRIVVVGPSGDPTADTLPYGRDDLVAAQRWLREFVDSDSGLAPWSIRSAPPPVEAPRRTLHQRLEMYDAWRLARTSEHLFVPDDLTLWLADDLSAEERTAGVVLRPLPASSDTRISRLDQNIAVNLLTATPPTTGETFPGRVFTVQKIADRVRQQVDIACLFRDGEVIPLADENVRAGDVLILPDSVHCTVQGVLTDEEVASEEVLTGWGDADTEVCFGDDPLCAELAGLSPEDAQRAYTELSDGDDRQIVLPAGSDDFTALPWVVVRPRRSQLDPDTMQESALRGSVPLKQHHENVAARARALAIDVGLSAALVDIIGTAAELHDEGKRDRRFQQRLGADRTDPVLAKSGRLNAQQSRRDAKGSGLRTGWRHEQLSAAVAATRDLGVDDADLVVRLVGTSHGYGRVEFDPPPADLISNELDPAIADRAHGLYGPSAGWHSIVERTEQRWGVWGCAFFEAVLRAADCQISREGS